MSLHSNFLLGSLPPYSDFEWDSKFPKDTDPNRPPINQEVYLIITNTYASVLDDISLESVSIFHTLDHKFM